MQKNDRRVDSDSMDDLRALIITLHKRYLLTYPVESAERIINKGFKIIITNGEFKEV